MKQVLKFCSRVFIRCYDKIHGSFGRLKAKNVRKSKLVAVVSVALILLCLIVGGTIAYLQDLTFQVTNTIGPAEPPEPIIEEKFENNIKKDVKVSLSNDVKEKGEYYIRAMVVFTLIDDDGNTLAYTPVENTDYTISMGSEWTKSGNFWYYDSTVLPGGSTSNLINECKTLSTDYKLSVEILAQSIQANPANAAVDSWGYSPAVD